MEIVVKITTTFLVLNQTIGSQYVTMIGGKLRTDLEITSFYPKQKLEWNPRLYILKLFASKQKRNAI